jgi:hypothetical protein
MDMPKFVAVLEDDADRLREMRACLADLLPQYQAIYFDNAFKMVRWLKTQLPQVVLISLDHDLPTEGDHGTGRQVVDFLAPLPATCPVIVHTSNEFFAPGMMKVLADGGWPYSRVYPHNDHNWIRQGWTDQIQKYIQQKWIFA